MMTKIFGAVLIVSGGYLLGRVPGYQNIKRIKAIAEIINVFQRYKHDLTEYRLPLQESFKNQGGIALEILNGCQINGLQSEDRSMIESAIDQLKNASYRESLDCVDAMLKAMTQSVEKLKASQETTGKALPLVTGVIGLLVAVLLF